MWHVNSKLITNVGKILDKNGKYNIPKEFQTDGQYGYEIKKLCMVLNTKGIVAIDRITDFVSSISYGNLNISNGNIVNFIEKLKNKCKPIIDDIESKILNSMLIYTDTMKMRKIIGVKIWLAI